MSTYFALHKFCLGIFIHGYSTGKVLFLSHSILSRDICVALSAAFKFWGIAYRYVYQSTCNTANKALWVSTSNSMYPYCTQYLSSSNTHEITTSNITIINKSFSYTVLA